eukprot:3861834-Lingulodinium_polyedra.AAC.1
MCSVEGARRAFDCAASQLNPKAVQRRGHTRVAPLHHCAFDASAYTMRPFHHGARARCVRVR